MLAVYRAFTARENGAALNGAALVPVVQGGEGKIMDIDMDRGWGEGEGREKREKKRLGHHLSS